MSKYGTDERGWLLVPCDPAVIPEGYEAMRVGWVGPGDYYAETIDRDQTMRAVVASGCYRDYSLILRPIPKPIRLPLAIVPHGWWVAKDEDGSVSIFRDKPFLRRNDWIQLERIKRDEKWRLAPPIVAQLPAKWRDLRWDKSAIQQTEGGEG